MDETADHPLRIAGRALTGALLTELAVCLAALGVIAALSVVDPSQVGIALGHAAGTGLGAAVALGVADAALARRRRRAGLALALTLSPLAALGGWYGLHLADTFSVREATVALVGVLEEALAANSLGGVGWLVGVAIAGYLPPLVLRRRGRGVVEQAARTTCLLTAAVIGAAVIDTESLAGWPVGGWAALVLVRGCTLPAGLALGDALGARLVATLRREERPARRRAAPVLGRRARWSLVMLLALLAALAPVARAPAASVDVLLMTWRASDPQARLVLAERLISEGVVEFVARDLGRSSTGGLQAGLAGYPPVMTGRWAQRDPRPVLVGQPTVALAITPGGLRRSLHPLVVTCLEPLARDGDVDAVLLLGGVLYAGTRLEDDVRRWWGRFHRHSSDERDRALEWARRAIALGPGVSEPRLGRGVDTPSWRSIGRAQPTPLVGALARRSIEEAVAFARVLAARDPTQTRPLNELLLARRGLRTPADDAFVAPAPAWTRPVPAERLARFVPEVPRQVPASASTAADALARRAVERWSSDPAGARALALEALAADDEHPEACLVVAAWHLREAIARRGAPGHLDVAEQHLVVVERLRPLDPVVLVDGALCDAVRALLAPGGDTGWATRALSRLHAAVALAPDVEGGRLALVEAALEAAGVDVKVERNRALMALAHGHARAAEAARSSGDEPAARARRRALEALHALVDEDLRPGRDDDRTR